MTFLESTNFPFFWIAILFLILFGMISQIPFCHLPKPYLSGLTMQVLTKFSKEQETQKRCKFTQKLISDMNQLYILHFCQGKPLSTRLKKWDTDANVLLKTSSHSAPDRFAMKTSLFSIHSTAKGFIAEICNDNNQQYHNGSHLFSYLLFFTYHSHKELLIRYACSVCMPLCVVYTSLVGYVHLCD